MQFLSGQSSLDPSVCPSVWLLVSATDFFIQILSKLIRIALVHCGRGAAATECEGSSMRKRRRKRGKGGADRTGINEWPGNRKGSIQALSCTCNDDVPRATGNFGNYVVPASLTGPVTRNCNLTPTVATCQFQLRVLSFLSILVHFLPPFIRLHLPCPFLRIRWFLTTTTSKLSTRYRLTTTSTWVCCDAKRCFKIFQLFEKCFAHEKKIIMNRIPF